LLREVMSFADGLFETATPAEASRVFFRNAERAGATYLQTRVYRRPATRLTPQSHWQAGGFVERIAPPSWAGSAAFDYVCFECNPLLEPIREGRTRYRFGDFAPHGARAFGAYWDALGEAGIGEALCATAYGRGDRIASLHLGFGSPDIPPAEAEAAQVAGLLLTEYLMSLAEPGGESQVRLSARELDCLAFVAEGKTDWEISVILGLSEATARFHVDNARRKLGAVTRAHAVARLLRLRLI
jgi:DNA-binding CsgD family transcriptional regulator